MKKISLVLTVILLAGCTGMGSRSSGASGSGTSESGTSGTRGTTGGYFSDKQLNDSNQNPIMDLRSRDHAFDPYFGG